MGGGNGCHAFTAVSPVVKKSLSLSLPKNRNIGSKKSYRRRNSSIVDSNTALQMGLDMVTYLRCEWISAALCTNQTPRAANVCLILGCEDGRPVTFVPRTIEKLITSTIETDGVLPVSVRRQLKQQEKNRGAAVVSLVDQRADNLSETDDESVDVVISLQTAAKMIEKGLDWKKGIQEAARVLKPGGRFLSVEQTTLDGESYLEYVGNLGTVVKKSFNADEKESNED